MINLTQYFIPGPQGTLALKSGTNFSYKGDHLQVYTNTEIDRWFVGAFTSANYFITVEFDSNQKESLQVLVVARPDHASFTVYGRTSVDDQLITITAEVTNSWLSLRASPANAAYLGARISLFATYSETMLPLKRPTAVGSFAPGGGGNGGTAPPPLPGGGGTGNGVSVEVSDTAPAATETGSLWFNSNTGELFVYYKDGTSDQWVQPASGSSITGSGNYILPPAGIGSGGALGGVKVDGTSITINNQVISATASWNGGTVANATTFSNTVNFQNAITAATIANIVPFYYASQATFPNATTYDGAMAHSHADGKMYFAHDGSWNALANLSDVSGSGSNSFATIAVAGQTSVAADSTTDTLTLVAGSGITLTTDATTDTITITGNGSSSNSFATIAVAGQTSVAADSTTDTLTLVAGTNVTINTNAITDTITINATGGATNLDGLSDVAVTSAASGQILVYTGSNFVNYTSRLFHQFAYPATTALDVTNNGASAYLFNNQYSGDNPTITAISGTTIAFNLNVSGHPFLIRTSGGTNYNTGLIHVAVDGTVSTGTNAQGKVSGTLYWQIPKSITGNYQYICSIHSNMVGVITVTDSGYTSSRTTVATTSATLASNASGTYSITGFKSYLLFKIQTSAAAWVTLYTDVASRTADASRSQTVDPLPGSGVIAEVITTGAETIIISPGTVGFNNETVPTTSIPIKIVNKGVSAAAITVTLTVLKMED